MVWNCEQVKQKGTQGRNARFDTNDEGIVNVLSEHEHVIDCIAWAPIDSARTIMTSTYVTLTTNPNEDDENEDEHSAAINTGDPE